MPGRWPDVDRRSTLVEWTRRRAVPTYAPITDNTYKPFEFFKLPEHTRVRVWIYVHVVGYGGIILR